MSESAKLFISAEYLMNSEQQAIFCGTIVLITYMNMNNFFKTSFIAVYFSKRTFHYFIVQILHVV